MPGQPPSAGGIWSVGCLSPVGAAGGGARGPRSVLDRRAVCSLLGRSGSRVGASVVGPCGVYLSAMYICVCEWGGEGYVAVHSYETNRHRQSHCFGLAHKAEEE
jgi:hypothetical protein